MNNLEKIQIDEFNKNFWNIPASSTVMSVMDNNQTDFSTKNFNPLNDSHHVDAMNVLQIIKPVGNLTLQRDSKSMNDLQPNFTE